MMVIPVLTLEQTDNMIQENTELRKLLRELIEQAEELLGGKDKK